MTRDECKALLPIVQAYAKGEVIEHLCGSEWLVAYNPTFSRPAKFYRIKPNVPAEVYVNVYPDGTVRAHQSKEHAEDALGKNGRTLVYVPKEGQA